MKNKVSASVLEKLAWPILVQQLGNCCQCEEAVARAHGLLPTMTGEQAGANWALLEPLKALVNTGYRAPIGALPSLGATFKAAGVGQILDGQELRSVLALLLAVDRVFSFVCDFSMRCLTLEGFRHRLLPLPKLASAILRAVDQDGTLLDEASRELSQIRRSKRGLKKKIEEDIHSIIKGDEFAQYLQDDFFTVRSERYVVPIRLDGRGRVKGTIVDTSSSGQTLFIEPIQISRLNAQLQELEIAEKLEMIRIFRELSGLVCSDIGSLRGNYESLVELDLLSAQADLAARQGAGIVNISRTPGIELKSVRHPLIRRPDGSQAVDNDVSLDGKQKVLVISGPNAGGKTVVLETVGMVHLMAMAGLLVPADPSSVIYFFDKVLLEMGDAQNLTGNLSTFSGHILGLRTIIEQSTPRDLILLDEIAVGTEPLTGSAIAQAILEALADREAITLATTHYDSLKGLAVTDPRFRNGSMEFSLRNLRPTYKLILDLPGQSYGLELAKEMGLAPSIIQRASALRGETATSLDRAVSDLMRARDDAAEARKTLECRLLEAEAEKDRWQREVELLNQTRQKAAKALSARYEEELVALRQDYDEAIRDFKKSIKEIVRQGQGGGHNEPVTGQRQKADKALSGMGEVVERLKSEAREGSELPGVPVDFDRLREGDRVYILSIHKEGIVSKRGHQKGDAVEIAVGLVKMRVSIQDLRELSKSNRPKDDRVEAGNVRRSTPTEKLSPWPHSKTPHGTPSGAGDMVIPTPRNTCDVRGLDLDDALTRMWSFIDSAVLRGEQALVIIHGHGTDRLKTGLRSALSANPPYSLRCRAGSTHEGGDGVTAVFLNI